MEIEVGGDKDLFNQRYHVVGYHLAIAPSAYEIEFNTVDGIIEMTSHFNVSPKTGCCIPFCCLKPCCRRKKTVVDQLDLETPALLRLRKSSAFCGLISCCEKGKTFAVNTAVPPFLILINDKEVFVLSPFEDEPSAQSKILIGNAIVEAIPKLQGVAIRY